MRRIIAATIMVVALAFGFASTALAHDITNPTGVCTSPNSADFTFHFSNFGNESRFIKVYKGGVLIADSEGMMGDGDHTIHVSNIDTGNGNQANVQFHFESDAVVNGTHDITVDFTKCVPATTTTVPQSTTTTVVVSSTTTTIPQETTTTTIPQETTTTTIPQETTTTTIPQETTTTVPQETTTTIPQETTTTVPRSTTTTVPQSTTTTLPCGGCDDTTTTVPLTSSTTVPVTVTTVPESSTTAAPNRAIEAPPETPTITAETPLPVTGANDKFLAFCGFISIVAGGAFILLSMKRKTA